VVADEVNALSTGGVMLSGDDPDDTAPVFVAPAGYVLRFMTVAQGDPGCTGSQPDFGWNQGASMGYVLLGTG
jgi:hypothetical protein